MDVKKSESLQEGKARIFDSTIRLEVLPKAIWATAFLSVRWSPTAKPGPHFVQVVGATDQTHRWMP